MRFLTIGCVLLMASTTEAKLGVDFNWGFMQGKAIYLDDGPVLGESMKSGSSWEHVAIEFTNYNSRDSVMTSIGVGISAFTTKSSTLYLGQVVTLDAKAATVTIWATKYVTEPGLKTRMYFQAGPSYSTLEFDLSAPAIVGAAASDEVEKLGFGVGVGASHRISKSMVFLLRTRYSYVKTDGTFDPSAFTATIGVGW
jgi:opacity protein-like surface antigen